MDCDDNDKQSENKKIRVAYQCPIKVNKDNNEKVDIIPYTFEDSLALTNFDSFKNYETSKGLLKKLVEALNKNELSEAREEMFNSLKTGGKAEMALELLYLDKLNQLTPPVYICNGLKWLEDKLIQRKNDLGNPIHKSEEEKDD